MTFRHQDMTDPQQGQLLLEFYQTLAAQVQASPHSQRHQRLTQRLLDLRVMLKQYTHPVRQEGAITAVPLAVRRAFVEAVVLGALYQQAVCVRTPLDTVGSKSLGRYQADPVAQFTLKDLVRAFDLAPQAEVAIAQRYAQAQKHIEQKHGLMALLSAQYDLSTPDAARPERILRLFQQLYGPVPVPAVALGIVQTDTQLFFCLPFQNTDFLAPCPAEDLASIQIFLTKISGSGFHQYARYPVFGFFDATQIPTNWLGALGAQLGLSADRVLDLLSEAVTVLPTPALEQFLIHDSWGHHWQVSLTEFGSSYRKLARLKEPLAAHSTTFTPQGPLALMDLFQVQPSGAVRLRRKRAGLFFAGEVSERVWASMTHVIAELTADLVEFKYALDHGATLPASSLFKDSPTKLDLGVLDLWSLCSQVLQPLLMAYTGTSLAEELIELLERKHQRMVDPVSLNVALADLHSLFYRAYSRGYMPTVAQPDHFFAQALSNLVYVHNVLDVLYPWPIPMPCRDLLVVFIGRFYEQDPDQHYWNLDEVLADHFLPCVMHLIRDVN